jgi:uroporphyrinogen-III synthase
MAKMLVTRPEPDAGESIARLRALGIEGIAAPLLERAALHALLPAPRGLGGIALTSANALRALDERGALGPYRGLKTFAVGEKTAAEAEALGFTDIVTAGGTLQHLVETIGRAGLAGPVFYPTARHQSADLGAALAPLGVEVIASRVYEMRAVSALAPEVLEALRGDVFSAALFYSRRTAETFVELVHGRLDDRARARLHVLCLAEPVAEPLLAARFVSVGLADQPSEAAMMTLALAFVREQNTP